MIAKRGSSQNERVLQKSFENFGDRISIEGATVQSQLVSMGGIATTNHTVLKVVITPYGENTLATKVGESYNVASGKVEVNLLFYPVAGKKWNGADETGTTQP